MKDKKTNFFYYYSLLLNGWSAALCFYSNRWRFTYEREREREREELGKNLWMNTKVYGPMSYSSSSPSSSQNNGLVGEVMCIRPNGELFLVMILNWNYFSFFRRHFIIFFSCWKTNEMYKIAFDMIPLGLLKENLTWSPPAK